MKVLLVSNLYPPQVVGGYELYCQDVAAELRASGNDVVIATSRPFNPAPGLTDDGGDVRRIFQPVYQYDGRLVHEVPLGGVAGYLRATAFSGVNVANAQALARCIEDCWPDQIWIFNPLALGPVGIVETALTSGRPVTILLADNIDGVVAACAGRQAWLPRWAALKRHVSAVACSERTLVANEVHGRYHRHAVIPLPVHVAATIVPPESAVSNGPLRLLYFGQIAAHKGVMESLRALAAFRQTVEGSGATLDFIGGGTESFRGEVSAQIATLGLGESVRVLGPMERWLLHRELPGYDAALLLLPEQEAFGMVAVEALFGGLPPVISVSAGVSKLLPQDYPLFVHDRGSADEVCARLQWCMHNRAGLRGLAGRVGGQLKALLSPPRVVREIVEFANGAPPPAHSFDLQELLDVATMVEIRHLL